MKARLYKLTEKGREITEKKLEEIAKTHKHFLAVLETISRE
jgi:DNA-binding PadR family transcriptional regulator